MAIETTPPEPVVTHDRKRRRERYALLRLGAWGGAAVIALGALALTTQTQRGSNRLQLAFATEATPVQVATPADVPTRVTGINPDSLRLEAQLRVLTADRDRLAARLASLERNLDDMTGSIKKQAALAAKTDAQPPVAVPTPPIIAPLAMPAGTATTAPWSGGAAAQASAPEPVPLPPVRLAVAPTNEPAAEAPQKSEIGIDIGGAATMDVLNARWIAIKANFGPVLAGMHPRVGHDHRPGITDLRLLVGPLPNIAAAAQLCKRFAAGHINCRTVKFDGERLAQR